MLPAVPWKALMLLVQLPPRLPCRSVQAISPGAEPLALSFADSFG